MELSSGHDRTFGDPELDCLEEGRTRHRTGSRSIVLGTCCLHCCPQGSVSQSAFHGTHFSRLFMPWGRATELGLCSREFEKPWIKVKQPSLVRDFQYGEPCNSTDVCGRQGSPESHGTCLVGHPKTRVRFFSKYLLTPAVFSVQCLVQHHQ